MMTSCLWLSLDTMLTMLILHVVWFFMTFAAPVAGMKSSSCNPWSSTRQGHPNPSAEEELEDVASFSSFSSSFSSFFSSFVSSLAIFSSLGSLDPWASSLWLKPQVHTNPNGERTCIKCERVRPCVLNILKGFWEYLDKARTTKLKMLHMLCRYCLVEHWETSKCL